MVGIPWQSAWAAAPMLTVGTRMIEVNKKAAKIFSVVGVDGKPGLFAKEGDRFAGNILNATSDTNPR